MISDGAKIGGLVFSKSPSPVDRRSAEELAALAGMGALALKRAQAETNLVRMTEELADVNRRLNQAQDELLQQRSMATVGEMAGGAAHEINNPLAIISGRAQQLLDKEKVKARRDMLESIASSAQRASDIVKELREFARPASPKPLVVAPADIAGGVAEDFAATAAEAQVELKAEVADNVPDIRVDAEQTRTALGEVLRNAVDACRDGGTITLGLEYLESESLVRFHVSDNGTGMDAATLSRAFHPFFCGLEAGRKRGLGLSIAYRLVEANGGKITLDSTPGRGTDVWIMFPLAPAAEAGDAEVKQ
jgi:signal transduction histidine kinase